MIAETLSRLKKTKARYIVLLIFLVTIFNLALYTANELRGNIRYLPLTSSHFGIPNYLLGKGLKPFYQGKAAFGWDGQFYYFMANDPLDLRGSAAHMDAPPYRYQRIGLSLVPYIASKILGFDWVSPELFLICYLLLFLGGLCALARILKFYNLSYWWLLGWGLFVGNQVTLLNFLPDLAADIFLFIALYWLWLKPNMFFYLLVASLAALSREIYILIFAGIFFAEILKPSEKITFTRIKRIVSLSVPGLVFLGWQGWCYLHFHKTPSSFAYGVIGTPILDWIRYLGNAHTVVDLIAMFCFFVLLIYQLYLLIRITKCGQIPVPLFICLSGIIFLYLSFGTTVLSNWNGYLKPASIFIITIPISFSILRISRNKFVNILLGFFLVSSSLILYFERLCPEISSSTSDIGTNRNFIEASMQLPETVNCLQNFQFEKIKITLQNEVSFYENEFIRKLFGKPFLDKMTFNIENLSSAALPVARQSGDVRLGYKIVDPTNGEVKNGQTTGFLSEALPPGRNESISLVISAPRIKHYKILVSLFQNGCFWFNEKHSEAKWEREILNR